ncbi:MAG: hypothetical protein QXY70_00715 [Nanopusillaceae archaeon]
MANWYGIVIRYTSQIPTLDIIPIRRISFRSESGITIDAFKIGKRVIPAVETSMIYFPAEGKDAFYSFWITTDYIRFVAVDKFSVKTQIKSKNFEIYFEPVSDKEYREIKKSFYNEVLKAIKTKKCGTAIIIKNLFGKLVLSFSQLREDRDYYYFDIFKVEKEVADRYILASEKKGMKHKYLVVYYMYAKINENLEKPILNFIDFYNIDFGEEFRKRMIEANRFDREFIYENLVDISTEFKEKIRLQAETEAEINKMFKLESWWEKYGIKILTILMLMISFIFAVYVISESTKVISALQQIYLSMENIANSLNQTAQALITKSPQQSIKII